MSWSPEFVSYIAGERSMEVWLLEVFDAWQEPNGGPYSIASAPGFADETLIGQAGPVVTGSRVTPVTWSSTIGGFTLPLSGDPTTFQRYAVRGSCVKLYLGRADWQTSQFEMVAWGMVWNIRGVGTDWVLDVRDPIQVLANTLIPGAPELFSGNGTTTTLTGSHTDVVATITVASTTGFSMDTNGAGVGLIKIDSEYIIYTSTTATTFEGSVVRGAFGTTAATHANLATVTECVILRGHPLDIVRRLLQSRASTGNSVWDDYPEKWAWGISQTCIDNEDIEAWKTNIIKVASGSYQWDIAIEGTWESPGSQLTSLLSSSGLFLTQRQGRLTCRGGAGPILYTYPAYVADYTITDADIVSGWGGISQESWDSTQSLEYQYVTFTTAADVLTTTAENASTMPMAVTFDHDASEYVRNNEAAVRNELSSRLANFPRRIPESIQLRCAGMRLAALTPGDLVMLTSARLRGRFASQYATGRLVYVAQVSANWAANTVDLRLLTYPTTSAVFE